MYQAIKNKISIEDLLQSSGTDKAGSAASSLMNLVMQFRKVSFHSSSDCCYVILVFLRVEESFLFSVLYLTVSGCECFVD